MAAGEAGYAGGVVNWLMILATLEERPTKKEG